MERVVVWIYMYQYVHTFNKKKSTVIIGTMALVGQDLSMIIGFYLLYYQVSAETNLSKSK